MEGVHRAAIGRIANAPKCASTVQHRWPGDDLEPLRREQGIGELCWRAGHDQRDLIAQPTQFLQVMQQVRASGVEDSLVRHVRGQPPKYSRRRFGGKRGPLRAKVRGRHPAPGNTVRRRFPVDGYVPGVHHQFLVHQTHGRLVSPGQRA